MVVADLPARVSATGVEVAQRDRPEVVGTVEGLEDPLEGEFGLAVHVGRGLGSVLVDRHLFGFSVDGGARGEDEGHGSELEEHLEQIDAVHHVVAPEAERVGHRLAGFDGAGEMHDRLWCMDAECLCDCTAIGEVGLDERHVVGECFAMSRRQIVEDDDVPVRAPEMTNSVRADVTGTTRDEHCGHGSETIREVARGRIHHVVGRGCFMKLLAAPLIVARYSHDLGADGDAKSGR